MRRFALALCALALVTCAGAQNTDVRLEQGLASGAVSNGIYTYKGIPYAKAQRFMPPASPDPWTGTRSFTDYGDICPQGMMGFGGQAPMSDDCQNLNIWTPGIHDGKKRPVMVWLHGGGFESGSSRGDTSDGENLSRRGDVVVVSINHRLNIVGHLDLSAYGEQYKYSGNVGILDIMEALRWMKANIDAFGGDPDNITLFGESGGGAKILVLNAMPSAHGLFNRGIVESGAVESLGMKVTPKEIAGQVTEALLSKLGLTAEDIDKLQTMPYSQLNSAGNEALREVAQRNGLSDGFRNPGNMSWAPVVDGDLLPQQPVSETGTLALSWDIPLILGSNFSEMNFMMTQDRNLEGLFGDRTDEVIAAFKKAYPKREVTNVLSVDDWIRSNTLKYLGIRAKEGGAPVYSYMFDLDNPAMPQMLVPHGAEIPFVFHNLGKGMMAAPAEGRSLEVANAMADAWIAFARTGNPSTESFPWPAFTTRQRATAIFGEENTVGIGYDDDLMSLLNPGYQFIF